MSDDRGGAVTAASSGGIATARAARWAAGVGRYELESKPWRPVAASGVVEPPRAWVRRTLDRAGRLVAVETFAGAAKPAPWSSNGSGISSMTYSYSGNVTTETGAAGRTREETRDALGRLITVGSTRLRLKADGTEVSRQDYEPFGVEITRSGEGYGAADLAQRFTGKERDAETGLDYFGARYMSAAQGRLTSTDPKSLGRAI